MHNRLLTVLPLLLSAAFAQDTNVALGGTATQSSFAGFGEQPGYAIDGNRDGYWWNSSTTCTANSPGGWWQVVLPSATTVNEVVIWNRADGWGERLSNFRVEVKNGATTVFSQDFFTSGGFVIEGGCLRVKVPGPGVTANTVRLSNLGVNADNNRHLQFAEVEVIRYGASREVNFARYGVATASSNTIDAPRLIDRNTDGMWGNLASMRTLTAAGSWVRVDHTRIRVDEIRLWPVTFGHLGCGNFRVEIFDGPTQTFSQDFYPATSMPRTHATVVVPPVGTFGDSVRVSTLGPAPNGERIELAEIEVLMFANYAAEQWVQGAGCRGAAGVPTLDCALRPTLDATLTYRVANVPATPGFAVQAIGLSNQLQAGGPLPADLGVLGMQGCWLLNSLDVLQAAAAVANVATFQLVLPNIPNVIGLRMWHQALVLDSTANAFGLTVSNGLEQFVAF